MFNRAYIAGLSVLAVFVFAGCQSVAPPQDLPEESMSDEVVTVEGEGEGEVVEIAMQTGWVEYGSDFRGYLAAPDEGDSLPGVVMIHEWWGLNENIMDMAKDLAGEGYAVLAVDLYDGKVTDSPEEAREYSGAVRENPDRAVAHMKAAADYLRRLNRGNGQVASMGWCFGGQQSLQLALNDSLDAAVIYYGNLETDRDVLSSSIDEPVLGVFGSEDVVVPLESVQLFEDTLQELQVDNEIYIYNGVGHAFANPSNEGHHPNFTEDAWNKTVRFLDRRLK